MSASARARGRANPALDPQRRLLDAAGVIFADKGFEGATVRDICKRGGVNIAAVNYYYRDKMRLYIETVKHAACAGPDLAALQWAPGTPPAVKLRGFIHTLMAHFLATTRPAWHVRLLMRELAQSTEACAELVRDYIRPLSEVLQGILYEVLPARTPRWRRYMIGSSIVGQCIYYIQNRPIVRLLVGEDDLHRFDVAALTEHITRFSLGGLGLPASVADRPAQR